MGPLGVVSRGLSYYKCSHILCKAVCVLSQCPITTKRAELSNDIKVVCGRVFLSFCLCLSPVRHSVYMTP